MVTVLDQKQRNYVSQLRYSSFTLVLFGLLRLLALSMSIYPYGWFLIQEQQGYRSWQLGSQGGKAKLIPFFPIHRESNRGPAQLCGIKVICLDCVIDMQPLYCINTEARSLGKCRSRSQS